MPGTADPELLCPNLAEVIYSGDVDSLHFEEVASRQWPNLKTLVFSDAYKISVSM